MNVLSSHDVANLFIRNNYDAAGAFSGVTGQQATASLNAITMGYDGDGLRLKKVENSTTTYYLRSSVLGQQVACELTFTGAWSRGYVYLGGQLLAIQDVPNNRVLWTHQEPYSKAQRITDASGAVVSGVEVEPFGLETNRSYDATPAVSQKRKFTTYDRDTNGGDEAMFRRYAPKQNRFAQPDPYDGSMSLANPQSLNRYAYVGGDPVSFTDPTGLLLAGPGTVCFLVQSGTHWTWGDGKSYDEIHSSSVVCFGGGGSAGGSSVNAGGGNNSSGNRPSQDMLPGYDQYQECKKLLGNAPDPGYLATKAIMAASRTEVTNASLIAVTWAAESNFNFNPVSNARGDGGWDVGPLQTATTYYDKLAFTNGLSNPFGTSRSETENFNGNSTSSVRVGARALNDAYGQTQRGENRRAVAAGIFRGGSRTGPGYSDRVAQFNNWSGGYDKFFDCLKKAGF